ncbi:MAG: hypothetical protein ACTHNQ_01950 [Microbacterium sp.]|uniref:hypothetical protein n=1 Tax=Microbacterium sp. TaxID=51671 RepID=UPI003F7E924A
MHTPWSAVAAVAFGAMLVVTGCQSSGAAKSATPTPTPSVAEVVGDDPGDEGRAASGAGTPEQHVLADERDAALSAASGGPTWLERMAQSLRDEAAGRQSSAGRCLQTQRFVNGPVVRVLCVDRSR